MRTKPINIALRGLVPLLMAVVCLYPGLLTASSNPGPSSSNSCQLVSAKEVIESVNSGTSVLMVDVRAKADFEKSWIPNSINMPLYEVRTKRFLKDRPFVLVDYGYRPRLLLDECKALRSQGFRNVSILTEGLNAWFRSDGELDGTAQPDDEISAAEFHAALSAGHAIPIYIGPENDPSGGMEAIANVHRIPFAATPGSFSMRYEKAISTEEKEGSEVLVLFDGDGRNYAGAREALNSLSRITPFFLKGGLRSYAQFLEDNKRLNAKLAEGEKECKTCP